MYLPRSSFYAASDPVAEDPLIGEFRLITESFRNYGYRRVTAELRHRGLVVNSKKVRRIMRENDLNPKRKRRYVATTDSSHDSPIYPNVAKGFEVHGPDQLWVGDITCVAIETGFVYLAVILDAWSRKVACCRFRGQQVKLA
jgi:putative transposase